MEEEFYISIIVSILCLLSYFLYCLNSTVEKVIGNLLTDLTKKLKTNKLICFSFGTIYSVITLGLNYTFNIVSGLLNANSLPPTSALFILIGSIFGTTFITYILTFKYAFLISIYLTILGTFMFFALKTKKYKDIGEITIYYGIIVFIIYIIYKLSQNFLIPSKILVTLSVISTFIFQNNTFIYPVIIALLSHNKITITLAVLILIFTNASLSINSYIRNANELSKKTLFIFSLYNLLAIPIFLILNKNLSLNTNFQNTYFIFTTIFIVLFIFITFFLNPSKLLPLNKTNEDNHMKLLYLDNSHLQNPYIAIMQTIKEILRMGKHAYKSVEKSLDLILNFDYKIFKNILDREELINFLEREITEYLVKLSNMQINEHQSKTISALYHIINDIERIGDHAKNLCELAEHKYSNSLSFSHEAIVQIKFMYQNVLEAVEYSLKSLENMDSYIALKTIELEGKIDKLDKHLRSDHIDRLNSEICFPKSGAVFLDIISNLERIGDHANNIAQLIIEINNRLSK